MTTPAPVHDYLTYSAAEDDCYAWAGDTRDHIAVVQIDYDNARPVFAVMPIDAADAYVEEHYESAEIIYAVDMTPGRGH